jgi:hypothetical protein
MARINTLRCGDIIAVRLLNPPLVPVRDDEIRAYAAASIFSISGTAFMPQPSLATGTSGLNFS